MPSFLLKTITGPVEAINVPAANVQSDLTWEMPSGWLRIGDARRRAEALIIPAVHEIIESVWASELPLSYFPEARSRVSTGVREAITALTISHTHPQAAVFWWNPLYVHNIAAYWEPAESSESTQGLSDHCLRAYRWSAAILNMHVRSQLENLHAQHTSDKSMPALNRAIRNLVFTLLLRDPWLGYYLARWPNELLRLKAQGTPIPVPKAAG